MRRCDLLGHKPKVTATVGVAPPNVWVQETCQRCKAKRQYVVHAWGQGDPTPWSYL